MGPREANIDPERRLGRQQRRRAWIEHHGRMQALHSGLAAEHARKAGEHRRKAAELLGEGANC